MFAIPQKTSFELNSYDPIVIYFKFSQPTFLFKSNKYFPETGLIQIYNSSNKGCLDLLILEILYSLKFDYSKYAKFNRSIFALSLES